MITQMARLENAARLAMGVEEPSDPLPPGPNYGPFGYFRLGILVFALLIVALLVYTFV